MVFTGSAAVEILRLIAHPSHSGVDQSSQDIATVARIGAKRSEESGKPEPLYLRKLDALPQIGFAVERA